MVFSNLFSSSFLINIAIFILIGCILAYVNYKITEQDHKLNSMIGLISTMAEEMHFFRSKLYNNNNNNNINDLPDTDKFQFASQMFGGSELIEVSDNEDLEDEDLEDEDLDEDLEDEDLDEDLEDEDLDEDLDEDIDEDLDEDLEDLDHEMINLSLENLSLPLDSSDLECINNDFELHKSIKTIHLEDSNLINLNENEINEDISFLKNVTEDEDSKTDYKKMSVNKLREIAVNKGFTDAGKLKKNDILKMLGEE